MRLVYSDRLRLELLELELFIASQGAPLAAAAYVDRLVDALDGLVDFPERCALSPSLGADIRAFVFEKRITVAFRIAENAVTLLALFAPGRSLNPIEDPA